MTINEMKKSEKIWTISTIANLFLVLYFSLLTEQCRKAGIEAQKAVPPPPPDDYIGALVYLLLVGASVVFGVLFLVSGSILLILFIKNKVSAARQK